MHQQFTPKLFNQEFMAGTSFAIPTSTVTSTKRMNHSIVQVSLGFTQPNRTDPLKISFEAVDCISVQWRGDILAVGVTERDAVKDENLEFLNPILQRLDTALGGLLSEATSEEDFTGKSGQSTVLRVTGFGSKRVALVGLGASPSLPSSYQTLGEAVGAASKSSQASTAAVGLASPDGIPEISKPRAASAIAFGVIMGTFEDNRFKTEYKKPTLKSVEIIGLGTGNDIDYRLKYANILASGVMFVKELVNAPANVLTPGALAEEAVKLASEYNDVLTATILDAEYCAGLKMGCFLAVSAASKLPPKFIHLTYQTPTREAKAHLALVGKGLTFDSGGYNLKTGAKSAIEIMKNDMGGAAAVLGAAKALAQIRPTGLHVHFIIATCENMISGSGMRPGDILTASNGKTVEVDNTDAEGRLTLADALVYACNQGVHKIVDLATLTGACIAGLGPSIAGVLSPNDELAKEVLAAAEASGEKVTRLPLEESYWELMKSSIADMLNAGPSDGGAITATLFMKQFVDEKVQWLHIDMAGPVWNDKKKLATGFGVTTLVEWMLRNRFN